MLFIYLFLYFTANTINNLILLYTTRTETSDQTVEKEASSCP